MIVTLASNIPVASHQAGIRFESPLWLAAIPVLLILMVIFARRLRDALAGELDSIGKLNRHLYWFPLFSRKTEISTPDINRTTWNIHLLVPMLLFFLALGSFFVALANPVVPGKKWPVKAGQRSVLLLLDTSISMMQPDYLVTGNPVQRIAFARLVSKRLLEGFRGDRTAMILFSEQAAVLFPFTMDHRLQSKQLQRADTELTGRANFLGHAMAYSIKFLDDWKQGRQEKWPGGNRPEVILITHGARPLGRFDPLEMAAVMASKGIRLHTVGIGGSVKPGDKNQLAKGLDYDPVNKPLLLGLARQTGGRFVHATSPDDITVIIKTIKARSRSVDTIAWIQKSRPLYFWPVLFGILLLAIAWLWRTLTDKGTP